MHLSQIAKRGVATDSGFYPYNWWTQLAVYSVKNRGKF